MNLNHTWTGKPLRAAKRLSLRLYVAGHLPRAEEAKANLKRLCAALGDNPPRVDIVDVFQQPGRTTNDSIVITPTLVRLYPKPVLKILGTLSDLERVRLALGLEETPFAAAPA